MGTLIEREIFKNFKKTRVEKAKDRVDKISIRGLILGIGDKS